MPTCLLVYVPSLPLRIADLMPQEELALAAGYLRQAGHTARILDLGTAASVPASPAPRGPRWLQRLRSTAPPEVQGFATRIGEVLSSEVGGFDLVAFLAREREGLAMSTKVGLALQAGQDSIRSVCFGPYAERFAPYISAYSPCFDTVIAEEPGTVLSCMLDDRELGWGGVPGLMVRERGGAVYTGRVRRANHVAPRPLPDYSEAVYPQLHSGEKLHYFSVRHGLAHSAITPSVMARARHIRGQFGGAPIHFEYGAALPAQLDALARGLARMGETGPCSLAAPVPAVAGLDPASLAHMRCATVSLELFSGSQRLLDDFFRAGFTITEVETALRTAQAGGASTHVSFTSPCPWEDHHTVDETARILRRNRPATMTTRVPELVPGSPWYTDPERYGFRLRHRQYARHAATAELDTVAAHPSTLDEHAIALGISPGTGAHELLCARLAHPAAQAGTEAGALARKIALGGPADLQHEIDLLNARIAEQADAILEAESGFLRAATGN